MKRKFGRRRFGVSVINPMPVSDVRFSLSYRIGTWPRSAHVRARIGTSEKFASSHKMMGQSLFCDFFYMRPNVSNPMFDLGRVVFFRLSRRHYGTKIQLAEQFSNVIEMVTNLKLSKDQISNDFCRPTISIVSARAGTFAEHDFEFVFLPRFESATSSATGFSSKSFQTVLVDFLSPSLEGRERDLQSVDDVIVCRSIKDHVSCQKSFLPAVGNPFCCGTHTFQYERNGEKVHFLSGRQ